MESSFFYLPNQLWRSLLNGLEPSIEVSFFLICATYYYDPKGPSEMFLEAV